MPTHRRTTPLRTLPHNNASLVPETPGTRHRGKRVESAQCRVRSWFTETEETGFPSCTLTCSVEEQLSLPSLDTEACLQRAGCVIKPRMYYLRVPRSGALTDCTFPFTYQYLRVVHQQTPDVRQSAVGEITLLAAVVRWSRQTAMAFTLAK